jgi:hypothetical protein
MTIYLRQVIKVIEWKNNAVYKTKTVRLIWVPDNIELRSPEENAIAKKYGGDFLESMSTDFMKNGEWYRSIPDKNYQETIDKLNSQKEIFK